MDTHRDYHSPERREARRLHEVQQQTEQGGPNEFEYQIAMHVARVCVDLEKQSGKQWIPVPGRPNVFVCGPGGTNTIPLLAYCADGKEILVGEFTAYPGGSHGSWKFAPASSVVLTPEFAALNLPLHMGNGAGMHKKLGGAIAILSAATALAIGLALHSIKYAGTHIDGHQPDPPALKKEFDK